jgi:hypothetical protein
MHLRIDVSSYCCLKKDQLNELNELNRLPEDSVHIILKRVAWLFCRLS